MAVATRKSEWSTLNWTGWVLATFCVVWTIITSIGAVACILDTSWWAVLWVGYAAISIWDLKRFLPDFAQVRKWHCEEAAGLPWSGYSN